MTLLLHDETGSLIAELEQLPPAILQSDPDVLRIGDGYYAWDYVLAGWARNHLDIWRAASGDLLLWDRVQGEWVEALEVVITLAEQGT